MRRRRKVPEAVTPGTANVTVADASPAIPAPLSKSNPLPPVTRTRLPPEGPRSTEAADMAIVTTVCELAVVLRSNSKLPRNTVPWTCNVAVVPAVEPVEETFR